ncbi:hypothetical protein J2S43_007523 [Catenuloplanes nepalensis]|uniref:Uncharacterized protein n=1 Tax=Catenuloplanes nepalensis TaxID=587533 RepID=A0ABT9N6X3_9ACTN|nr:hypothetical protein [Catenuloplanes nepalensis]MDP9799011.1 hypothetical protein [Catenuloplanes nepalensis]
MTAGKQPPPVVGLAGPFGVDARLLVGQGDQHGREVLLIVLAGLLRFDGVGHYLSADAERAALEAELAAYRGVLRQAGVATPV